MMDNKEILRHAASEDETAGSNGDVSTLDPLYKAGEDFPHITSSMDVDQILAEFRAMHSAAPQDAARTNETPHGARPNEPPEDQDVEQQLLDEMKALREEVKQLRSQIEAGTYSIAAYPRGEPRAGSDPDGNDGTGEKPNIRGEPGDNKPTKKKRGRFWWIGEVVFYLVLIAIIAGAFLIKSSSGGKPTSIAGYSAFTVLTSSMEDTIPKGSLVITKSVDPSTLKINDDITYMSSATTTITHRIVDIVKDYPEKGSLGFITKGTMNAERDDETVAAANIVGKVVFHSKALGDIATFVSKNWPIILFVVVVFVALFYVLKWILNKEEPEKEQEADAPKKRKREKTGKHSE